MKLAEQGQARRLRAEEGLSIGRIAELLTVSKGSVSRWVGDIELSGEQEQRLREANPLYNGQHLGQRRRSEQARAARAVYQAAGRSTASKRDPLHIEGCMLFWAEGSKNKNQVAFTNSDVEMMQLFRHFLAACYSVPDDRMVLSCNCFLNNGLTLEEIEAHWLRSLALPQTCLRKAVINQASRASGRGKRTLPYGTARIVVNSTEIVQSIYGAIQEYAGIERPAWLDCR